MDDIDRKILRELQKNPSLSVVELGERVALSHTPCWRRLKKLEASGVIRERSIVLDPKALDLNVVVFANVKLKQHDETTLEALENAVRNHPEITACYSMSGESDYVMRIVVRNIDDYEIFLKKVLLHLPGVGATNSNFALKCIKDTTALPI